MGGRVTAVGPGSVMTAAGRLELDLIAVDATPRGRIRVCALGEAKSGIERVGTLELDRLDHAVAALPESDESTRRVLVSRAGFTRELEQRARRRGDVELVDLAQLFG